jgi:thiamine kinase-like enzyme
LCGNNKWAFIHGDFQFENLIYNPAADKFTCIDWRTDFGNDSYGDVYYDLAKMLGGIYLNYQKVKEGLLEYYEHADSATVNDCSVSDRDVYVSIIRNYCEQNNLSWSKVQLLVPIIYLNMSPLHETPFDKYLFALAQLHFSKIFE